MNPGDDGSLTVTRGQAASQVKRGRAFSISTLVPGDRRAVTAFSHPPRRSTSAAYPEARGLISGSKATASTHELGLDTLWGPAQDCADLSCRELDFMPTA